MSNLFVTGTGQWLEDVHAPNADCYGLGCVIHNPTDKNQDFPTHWRSDRHIFERICPHGIGHPDADDQAWHRRNGRMHEGVHGCDGCCGYVHISPTSGEDMCGVTT